MKKNLLNPTSETWLSSLNNVKHLLLQADGVWKTQGTLSHRWSQTLLSWGHQTSSGSFQVQKQTGIEYFAAHFTRDELRKLAGHWWLLQVKWLQKKNPAPSIMFVSCTL